jgi:frataxin-like iron-binding protein CyaY
MTQSIYSWHNMLIAHQPPQIPVLPLKAIAAVLDASKPCSVRLKRTGFGRATLEVSMSTQNNLMDLTIDLRSMMNSKRPLECIWVTERSTCRSFTPVVLEFLRDWAQLQHSALLGSEALTLESINVFVVSWRPDGVW